jgi:prepilin-type N-terminal cleavage/methylation domain-containing protein
MTKSRGFTLIEVSISIFIIGIMLLIAQAVIQSSTLVRASKNQGIALSIARNEIEILRAGGYEALPVSGSFLNDLLNTLPSATAERTVTEYNEKTKQVTVGVVWREPNSSTSSVVSLSTLITQVGGLP